MKVDVPACYEKLNNFFPDFAGVDAVTPLLEGFYLVSGAEFGLGIFKSEEFPKGEN